MTRQRSRRASVLVLVLVCAVVALGLLATTIRGTLLAHRNQKSIAEKCQVELLVDAGIQRAVQQLKVESSYSGETWDVSQAFDSIRSATVDISVERRSVDEPSFVTIRARITNGYQEIGIQRSHSFQWSTNEEPAVSGE